MVLDILYFFKYEFRFIGGGKWLHDSSQHHAREYWWTKLQPARSSMATIHSHHCYLSLLFVDARWSHTKPRSLVRQVRTALDLNQCVPVNLTCKLTKKQQTVKFKSVSTGFSNHSYVGYRQDYRYRRRQKIGYDKRVIKAIYKGSAMSCRCR